MLEADGKRATQVSPLKRRHGAGFPCCRMGEGVTLPGGMEHNAGMMRLISQTPVAMPIGVVAASSPVPQVEFGRGAQRLREAGFELFAHEQVRKQHFLFAGTDEERAGGAVCLCEGPAVLCDLDGAGRVWGAAAVAASG